MKRMGPSTEPWGTPWLTGAGVSLVNGDKLRLVAYEELMSFQPNSKGTNEEHASFISRLPSSLLSGLSKCNASRARTFHKPVSADRVKLVDIEEWALCSVARSVCYSLCGHEN